MSLLHDSKGDLTTKPNCHNQDTLKYLLKVIANVDNYLLESPAEGFKHQHFST